MLTIIKKCREYEVDVYECIHNTDSLPKDVNASWREFYQSLRHFVPKYYGAQLYDVEKGRFNVRLQNLLNLHKGYSYDKVLAKTYST